jgi:hypothetical protein
MITPPTVPENAEVDGLECRPPHHVDLAEIGRHRAPDDVGHAVGASDQILRSGADDDCRLYNDCQQRQHQHEAQREADRSGPAALGELRGRRVAAQAASFR